MARITNAEQARIINELTERLHQRDIRISELEGTVAARGETIAKAREAYRELRDSKNTGRRDRGVRHLGPAKPFDPACAKVKEEFLARIKAGERGLAIINGQIVTQQ